MKRDAKELAKEYIEMHFRDLEACFIKKAYIDMDYFYQDIVSVLRKDQSFLINDYPGLEDYEMTESDYLLAQELFDAVSARCAETVNINKAKSQARHQA